MRENETIESRRYPSRKLCNRTTSSYVRLPEAADLSRTGATLRVEDAETGEDATCRVLLPFITDQEGRTQGNNAAFRPYDGYSACIAEVMTGLFGPSVAFLRPRQERLASKVRSEMAGGLPQPWAVFDTALMLEIQRDCQKRLARFWLCAAQGRDLRQMGAPCSLLAIPRSAELSGRGAKSWGGR